MDQLVAYDAPFVAGDDQNTASAYVKRGSDSSIRAGAASFAGNANITGQLFLKLGSGAGAAVLTANTTLDQTQTVWRVSTSGGAVTLTLPPASTSSGAVYLIVVTGYTSTLTLKGSGTDNVNAANTYTGLAAQWQQAIVWCDGTQWYAARAVP